MRVLLVDDHEIIRRGLMQLLAEEYPAATFGEAAKLPEAREKLTLELWDLVLLDINLPGGSGLELLQEISSKASSPKVLVLSSYPEEDCAVRSFKLGADGYLNKGSMAEEMLLAVKKTLDGGKYVSALMAEKLAAEIGSGIKGKPHEALSVRELEVLRMVASGKTIKVIAADLSLSDKTIATYRARISRKLALSTNVELARYAIENGLAD